MKHFQQLLLVLFALVTFSCGKNEPENTESIPSIILNNEEYIVKSEGEAFEVYVASNVDVTYMIEYTNEDGTTNTDYEIWLQESETKTLKTNTYCFIAITNKAYNNRYARIVFSNKENNLSDTLRIVQLQKDAIVLAKNEYKFCVEGGKLDFEIQTNVDVKVEISDNAKSWITQIETRGLQTKSLCFNVASCNETDERQGTIKLMGGEVEQIITVKQNGLKEILEKERAALIAFYNATGGDNWTNNENWCSDKPVGEWYGIETDELGRVCGIDLSRNNLVGEIPLELCELDKLRILYLLGNKLSGYIPEEIGNLSKLELLHLMENNLKGPIPKSIGKLKNLQYLYLGDNNLEGTIPPEIGNLTELKEIFAHGNMLSGSIPEEFCQLTNLERVFIRSTLLSGPIPENIGNLKKLTLLNLCQNKLSGKVPESITTLENLEELTLVENFSLEIDLPQSTFLDTHWGQMLPYNIYDLTKLHINFNSFNMLDLNGNRQVSENVFSSNKYTLMYHFSTNRMYENANHFNRLKQLYSDFSEDGFEIIGYINGDYNGYNVPQLKDVETFISENDIPWPNVFMTQGNCINSKYDFYPEVAPTFTIVDSTGRVVFFNFAKYDNEIESVIGSVVGFVNIQFGSIYESTDYSQDGVDVTLQSATEGKGINVVLLGDGYSDRQIADGTYKRDMEFAYNNLFTEEPYNSYRNLFNVSYVNVVSPTEGFDYGSTALSCGFGNGTYVYGNDNKCFEYAQKVVDGENINETLIVVVLNSNRYAGTCFMYYPVSSGDYGSGPAVAYFPKGEDETVFAQLLHHEACGHGFAKLADEYAYEYMGTVPMAEVTNTQTEQSEWGWWKNVDFTDDLALIKWAKFISDTRYQYDGLGAFEGGLTYWSGVWRPTDNSIMRHNYGGFNAPSREAIYYRMHKLAYGSEWEYDYEKFAEYDAVNRKSSAEAAMTTSQVLPLQPMEPTHPPVVVKRNWKDVK